MAYFKRRAKVEEQLSDLERFEETLKGVLIGVDRRKHIDQPKAIPL